MSKKFFSPSKASKNSLLALLCAGFLWSSGPALAQRGSEALDPRLTIKVAEAVPPDTDSVLLLDDIQFVVFPDRTHSFDEHDAMKVLSKQGVEENATLVRVVDTSKSKVDVLLARTIKADGRVLDAPPPQLTSLSPDSATYGSVKRFSIRFPNVEIGDVVEFHIRTTHKQKRGGHFWATTYVQNPMPIVESTFTVIAPENIPFQTATPGHPTSKPVETRVERNGVTYKKLRWGVKKEAAYDFQPLAPKTISLLKRIEVSSFRSWDEVRDYVQEDWDAQKAVSSGLALRVAGWMPDSGEIDQRASALMKNLNYGRKVASFLGEEPEFHEPESLLDEILVSSADQALIASVGLNAVGITNIPIATLGVNAKSLEDELPNPEKVNKIILEIPRGGQSSLWFDPESPGFVLDALPDNTSDTAAFSWDQRSALSRGSLSDLQLSSAFDNREELAVEGRLEKTGRAELTVQYDRYGAKALGSRQAARDIQDEGRDARDKALQSFFRSTTRAFGPRTRLLGRYFELDSEAADPFTLSFTVAVPGFAKVQDTTMLVPLPRFLSSSLRVAARQRDRKTPLVFEQPYQQDVRIHLIFPEGSEVANAPDSISKETPEARFFATGRSQGNEVWYVGRLTVFDPWIEDEALQRSLDTIGAALKSENTILKVELPSKVEVPSVELKEKPKS